MKMKAKDLSRKFEIVIGDSSLDIPTEFLIQAINWCFNELPRVPKLNKLFTKHYTVALDAKDHYRWDLNQDFRRISDIPMINFWTSTGGEPCRLKLCNKTTKEFYDENGLPELRKAGTPCAYTIEREDDHNYLVIDRPSNVPVIVDYIAYGYPAPISSLNDEIEISAVAENLMLDVMKTVFYMESSDFAFSGAIEDFISNTAYREAIQDLYHRYKSDEVQVLGER